MDFVPWPPHRDLEYQEYADLVLWGRIPPRKDHDMPSNIEELIGRIHKTGRKLPSGEALEIAAKGDNAKELEKVIILAQSQIAFTARERDQDEALAKAREKASKLGSPYATRIGKSKSESDYATLISQLPDASRASFAQEARERIKRKIDKEKREPDEDNES